MNVEGLVSNKDDPELRAAFFYCSSGMDSIMHYKIIS